MVLLHPEENQELTNKNFNMGLLTNMIIVQGKFQKYEKNYFELIELGILNDEDLKKVEIEFNKCKKAFNKSKKNFNDADVENLFKEMKKIPMLSHYRFFQERKIEKFKIDLDKWIKTL